MPPGLVKTVLRGNAKIVVARDGIWPTVWRWSAEVPVQWSTYDEEGVSARGKDREHLRGDAITKARAWKKALHAIKTMEVR